MCPGMGACLVQAQGVSGGNSWRVVLMFLLCELMLHDALVITDCQWNEGLIWMAHSPIHSPGVRIVTAAAF